MEYWCVSSGGLDCIGYWCVSSGGLDCMGRWHVNCLEIWTLWCVCMWIVWKFGLCGVLACGLFEIGTVWCVGVWIVWDWDCMVCWRVDWSDSMTYQYIDMSCLGSLTLWDIVMWTGRTVWLNSTLTWVVWTVWLYGTLACELFRHCDYWYVFGYLCTNVFQTCDDGWHCEQFEAISITLACLKSHGKQKNIL